MLFLCSCEGVNCRLGCLVDVLEDCFGGSTRWFKYDRD